MKHNNSHLEIKSGTRRVCHVRKSVSKDGDANMFTFVLISSTITSSMGFSSARVKPGELYEIITPLKKNPS